MAENLILKIWMLFFCVYLFGCGGSSGENGSTLSPSVDLTTGLVSAFGFSEGAGTTTADKSNTGNTLTLTAPTWTASGHTGEGLTFNGATSKGATAPSATLVPTTSFTIMAWVYPTVDPGSGERMVADVEFAAGGFPISLEGFDYLSNAGKPSCSREHGGVFTPSATWSTKLSINTWTHLACTYDGSNIVMYINGNAVSTVAATGTVDSGTNYMDIGWSQQDGGDYFTGTVDDVRLFVNRALTLSQIQSAMNTPVQ